MRIYGRRVPRLIAGIVVRVATRIMIPIFLLPILAIAVLTLVVILVAIPVAVSATYHDPLFLLFPSSSHLVLPRIRLAVSAGCLSRSITPGDLPPCLASMES
jgi:hypothetical protein